MTEINRILTELIAFDTTSRNSNLDCIDYIRGMLDAHGIQSWLSYDASKTKANLFATLGESTEGGVVLSGHTDVVPVDGQTWSTDPFVAEIKAGRLYGRGACDMKGFIAVCLSKIDAILEAELNKPIHFAFSYDEEVGCIGVKGLLDQLQERRIQPDTCIIGEPTSMGVIRAHKGMLMHRCRVHGHSSHSSLVHQGVNAVTLAARAISYIDDVAEKIRNEGPFDEAFDPPYTTLHSGVINGGTVNNIIPNLCEFLFEIRHLPNHNALSIFNDVAKYAEDILQTKISVDNKTGQFEWQHICDFPGLDTDENSPLVKEVNDLLKSEHQSGKVSYGTEGGHFQAAGIETVICGPGSIEKAHKPDEYVDLSQLEQCNQFLSALISASR